MFSPEQNIQNVSPGLSGCDLNAVSTVIVIQKLNRYIRHLRPNTPYCQVT